jgi:signal transduction histidine kinase
MKRWIPLKVLVPLAAGLALSITILVFAELGHRRLERAASAVNDSLAAQSAVNEVLVLASDAETGQRGFLLTGRKEYLEPYTAAIARMDSAIGRLRDRMAGRTSEERERVGRLTSLIGRKLAEMESTLALYRTSGRDTAFELVGTDIGRRTMDQIRTVGGEILDAERAGLSLATAGWQQDIERSRRGMQVLAAIAIGLLLVVWMLSGRELALRERARAALAEDQRRLEALVEERTGELSELSDYLQEVGEKEKSKLARDIHDELGSILVSAKMDISWVQSRLRGEDAALADKLGRALSTLDEGVEIKRRLIEELRPTLLDNLGLGAAIEWQVNEVCGRSGLACDLHVPEDDDWPPEVSIALFRIVQEALTNVVRYAKAARVSVDLTRDPEGVTLVVSDDGIGIPEGALRNRLSHGILGMRQRVRALKGEFSIRGRPGQGTVIEVRVPLPVPATAALPAPGPA